MSYMRYHIHERVVVLTVVLVVVSGVLVWSRPANAIGNYNRSAAVAYADQWALSRNSNYPQFGNAKAENGSNNVITYITSSFGNGSIPGEACPSTSRHSSAGVWVDDGIGQGRWGGERVLLEELRQGGAV